MSGNSFHPTNYLPASATPARMTRVSVSGRPEALQAGGIRITNKIPAPTNYEFNQITNLKNGVIYLRFFISTRLLSPKPYTLNPAPYPLDPSSLLTYTLKPRRHVHIGCSLLYLNQQ